MTSDELKACRFFELLIASSLSRDQIVNLQKFYSGTAGLEIVVDTRMRQRVCLVLIALSIPLLQFGIGVLFILLYSLAWWILRTPWNFVPVNLTLGEVRELQTTAIQRKGPRVIKQNRQPRCSEGPPSPLVVQDSLETIGRFLFSPRVRAGIWNGTVELFVEEDYGFLVARYRALWSQRGFRASLKRWMILSWLAAKIGALLAMTATEGISNWIKRIRL